MSRCEQIRHLLTRKNKRTLHFNIYAIYLGKLILFQNSLKVYNRPYVSGCPRPAGDALSKDKEDPNGYFQPNRRSLLHPLFIVRTARDMEGENAEEVEEKKRAT